MMLKIRLQFQECPPTLQYLHVDLVTAFLQFEVDERIVGDPLIVDIRFIVQKLSLTLVTYIRPLLPYFRGTSGCLPARCPC
jgi:hypothetical protein